MGEFTMTIKRRLRPFIPDDWVDRYHRFRGAREARVNVDVVVEDSRQAMRWLATMPDTYRVISRPRKPGSHRSDVHLIGSGDANLAGLIGEASAVVEAEAEPPPLGAPGTEPKVAPIALAVTRDALADVGTDDDLVVLVDRLRQAGHRLVLVPRSPGMARWQRTEPIELPCAVVLGMVPLHDVGGGSRGAQLAQELLARGYHVVYVPRFASTESVDTGVRVIHPALEQVWFEDFSAAQLKSRLVGDGVVIVEAPVDDHVATAKSLGDGGLRVIYDLIDDWRDKALGADWYRPALEVELADAADSLVASSEPLARHLEALSDKAVALVPNGVNTRVFSGEAGPPPDDLPRGYGPLLGYHGSLYGTWFDWDGVAKLAESMPDARIVLIGDPRRPPAMPGNVTLLGLRAQTELPPYLAAFDVGLVPFTVSPTTHAVSPLKVYEYLAMGVPVAAAPLRALEGIAGVHTSPDLVVAVRAALGARRVDGEAARLLHSWGERLGRMLAPAGLEPDPGSGIPPRVEVRPYVKYPLRKRWVR